MIDIDFEDTQTMDKNFNKAEARMEIIKLREKGFYAYAIKVDKYRDKFKIKYRKYNHKFYRENDS